jgi:transposase InsO family protein
MEIRKERRLGARGIQHEMIRIHDCHLSLATIHKVLQSHKAAPLHRLRRNKKFKRYEKKLPGERVQLDTVKIAPGIYQYTAVDDYSRFLVTAIYSRSNAKNTIDFLELLLDAYTVPIQYIQTDRGAEFMAEEVQAWLKEHYIKYRPNKPGSPHLNGKVERVQRTALDEFYSGADLKSPILESELGEWVMYYNYQRIHGSFGTSPMERFAKKIDEAPFWEEVSNRYDSKKERFQVRNYVLDQQLKKLKNADENDPAGNVKKS